MIHFKISGENTFAWANGQNKANSNCYFSERQLKQGYFS